jgi:hypothetical protein
MKKKISQQDKKTSQGKEAGSQLEVVPDSFTGYDFAGVKNPPD